MNFATLFADVISYNSLPEPEKRKLESAIKELLNDLSTKYKNENFYGRLAQGDY